MGMIIRNGVVYGDGTPPFYAIYDETSYDEIAEAEAAGKVIVACKEGVQTDLYYQITGGELGSDIWGDYHGYVFTRTNSDSTATTIHVLTCRKYDGGNTLWESNEYSLVGKEIGKGLSTNDYSDAEKAKVNDIVQATTAATVGPAPIVTFDASAANMPLKQLVVDIKPVQDLHGYDSPWPAGGWKNLLDPAKCSTSAAYELTTTHDQETGIWTISGTPNSQSESLAFSFCFYSDFSLSGKGYAVQVFPLSGTPIKNFYGFRTESEKAIAIIFDSVANPTINVSFKVSVAATSQTAWTPYSNICPISGWTGCNVYHGGDNLFGGAFGTTGAALYDIPTGTQSLLISSESDGLSKLSVRLYDGSKAKLGSDYPVVNTGVVKNTLTRAVPDGAKYFSLYISTGGASSSFSNTIVCAKFDTYPITFPTEAGTVYGGTLDATSGVLTVTHQAVVLNGSESNWGGFTADGNTRNRVQWNGYNTIGIANAMFRCDKFNPVSAEGTKPAWSIFGATSASRMYFTFPNSIDSIDSWKAWLADNNVTVVYPIASPVEIPLTAEQITTLFGTNNIWADCGDGTVTYGAYLETLKASLDRTNGDLDTLRACIAPIEDGATASQAYIQGAYFFRNGNFCTALTAISVGAAFTLGTNYQATTVAAALIALQS